MGWICILAISKIIAALPSGGFAWLLAGGIIYTVGGIIYALKLPIFNSRHRYFGSHDKQVPRKKKEELISHGRQSVSLYDDVSVCGINLVLCNHAQIHIAAMTDQLLFLFPGELFDCVFPLHSLLFCLKGFIIGQCNRPSGFCVFGSGAAVVGMEPFF